MLISHYIGLVHKDPTSGYGLSFPDVPGVITVADTIDDAIAKAAAALAFAFEDGGQAEPRTLEALRLDPEFQSDAADAVIAAIRPSAQYYQAAE